MHLTYIIPHSIVIKSGIAGIIRAEESSTQLYVEGEKEKQAKSTLTTVITM